MSLRGSFLAAFLLPLLIGGGAHTARAQYAGLIINEFLAQPTNSTQHIAVDANSDGVNDKFDDEFVEFLNTSTNSIDVAGLILRDAQVNIARHVFTSRVLPPGGSMVVFGGGSVLNFTNQPAQVASHGGLSLNDDSDTISLYSPQTSLIDQVVYSLPASYAAISSTRQPDGTGGFTNHYLATTNAARASPGRSSHGQAFLTNQPPVIVDLDDKTAFIGLDLPFPVRAYDPADGNAVTLTVLNNPPNSSLDATSGVGTFHFTPAANQAGQNYTVSFVASDVDGAETDTISMTVVSPVTAESVWINEIHYDNTNVDVDEGVEIAGSAGTVLDNYSLYLYDGDFLKVDVSNALVGTIDNEQCGFGAVWFPFNQLENAIEGIALAKGTSLVQFLSYEGSFTPTNGPAAGMTSVDLGVSEEPPPALGYALQLAGTGTEYSAFTWVSPRPHSRGTLNTGQAIACAIPGEVDIQKTVYLGHNGGASCQGVEFAQGTNGATITYCFVVNNTGGATLTNAAITDENLGITPIGLGTLVPGQVATAHVDSVINGDLRNTATITSYDQTGNPVVDSDSAEVAEILPALLLHKTVYLGHNDGASCPGFENADNTNGAAVTYCFEVINAGNTNLTSVTLSDPALGITSLVLGALSPGQFTNTYVEQFINGDLTNTATAAALDPNSDPVTDDDTATVHETHPAITIQKTVYRGYDAGASCPGAESVQDTNGAPVTYCLFVSNVGDVTLTNATITDDLLGISPIILGTLAAGEVMTSHIETVVGGSLTNTATVTADDPQGNPYSNNDSAEVVEIHPELKLQKTVYLGHDGAASCPGLEIVQGTNGAPVTYCFEVHNAGDADLANITLSDPSLGITSMVVGALGPGGFTTVSAEGFVNGDLTNTATVSAEDPNSNPVADSDSAIVDETHAGLLIIQKTVYRGQDAGASCPGMEFIQDTNGAPITYCLMVTNAGDATLTNAVITDDTLGMAPILLGTLDVGQVVSVYVETNVTAALTNTAAVTAHDLDGNVVDAIDTAEVGMIHPELTIQKTVYQGWDDGASCPGGEFLQGTNNTSVTYCFRVINSGDTTLTNVSFNDLTLGIVLAPLSNMIAGQVETRHTQQLINASLTNTAVATGFDPNGNLLSPSDTAEVELFTPPPPACTYLLTDLGTLGGNFSMAYSINDQGKIVGQSSNVLGRGVAFIWQNGVMSNLLNIATITNSRALKINSKGHVVGRVTTTNGTQRAFLFTNGIFALLGNPSGTNFTEAKSLNDRPLVVGDVVTNTGSCPTHPISKPHPTLWTNKTSIDLGAFNGTNQSGCSAGAFDINNSTQVVGYAYKGPGDVWHPYVWADTNANGMRDMTEMIDLGTLGAGFSEGWAQGINDLGQIVGWATISGFWPRHAFLVTPQNGVWWRDDNTNGVNDFSNDLGLMDGTNCEAQSLNDSGVVVGFVDKSNAVRHAFVYDGTMHDLNDLVCSNTTWILNEAMDINNSGQIVGYGVVTGQTHGFLLTPGIGGGGTGAVDITRIITGEGNPADHTLIWRGAGAGLHYTLEASDSITGETWSVVAPTNQWPIQTTFWRNNLETNRDIRFYRVRINPAP